MNPNCRVHGCRNPAVTGGSTCRAHGGAGTLRRLRGKALVGEAEEEIAAALASPDLMDVRRPVAMNEAVIRRTPLIATEEMAARAAKRRIAREIGFDLIKVWRKQIVAVERLDGEAMAEAMSAALDTLLEPDDGDLDLETLAIHERSQRMLTAYAKTQVDAAKALDWAATMRGTIVPILSELSMRMAALLRKHVEPGKVVVAIDELTMLVQRTVGELSEAKEKA